MPFSSGATSAPLRPHPLTLKGESGHLAASTPNDSSNDTSPCPSYNLDSIDMRRRHGEYFHRPPVWFPRACSYGTSSATSRSDDGQPEKESVQHTHQPDGICPSCSAGLDLHDSHQCLSPSVDLVPRKETVDLTPGWNPSASTHVDDGHESDMARSEVFDHYAGANQNLEQHVEGRFDTGLSDLYRITLLMPPEEAMEFNFHYQRKVALCTRLQFCRDVRCPPDEQWTMQEGSLVVGIQPAFVGVTPERSCEDEFELRLGRLFVIVHMYADLWAYCIDVSLDADSYNSIAGPPTFNAGFLPLCAVTLPGNFDRFLKRCGGRYTDEDEIEPECPWNGQVVVPPRRSHSLKAATEMMQPGYKLLLQPMTRELLNNFALFRGAGNGVVPLDAPVKDLLAMMGTGAKGSSWLRRMLRRRGTGMNVSQFVRNRFWSRPRTRRAAQRHSTSSTATNSTRSEEQQPERMSKSQYTCRAVSYNLGKLLGLSKKPVFVTGSSEKCVQRQSESS